MDYDSILTVSRPPYPPKHPPMTSANRAAQFAPFSALVGLENALEDTAQTFLPASPRLEDMWDCFQEQGLMYFLDLPTTCLEAGRDME